MRLMAAGDGAQLPATVAASRSVEKALEEAASSGALNLVNRKLKEFPRSARNYDLSDITHAGLFPPPTAATQRGSLLLLTCTAFCFAPPASFLTSSPQPPYTARRNPVRP